MCVIFTEQNLLYKAVHLLGAASPVMRVFTFFVCSETQYTAEHWRCLKAPTDGEIHKFISNLRAQYI